MVYAFTVLGFRHSMGRAERNIFEDLTRSQTHGGVYVIRKVQGVLHSFTVLSKRGRAGLGDIGSLLFKVNVQDQEKKNSSERDTGGKGEGNKTTYWRKRRGGGEVFKEKIVSRIGGIWAVGYQFCI